MEEMFIRVWVVVVSLLYLKEHTVVDEQDDDIISSMQHRELLLEKEGAKLEQEVYSVAMDSPHCNQEVSQSHCRLTKGEGVEPDVQQTLPSGKAEMPNEHKMLPSDDLNILHPKDLPADDQHDIQAGKNVVKQNLESNSDSGRSQKDMNLPPKVGLQHGGQNEAKHIPSKMIETVSQKETVQVVDTVDENQIASEQKQQRSDQSAVEKMTSEQKNSQEEHESSSQYDFSQIWSQIFQTWNKKPSEVPDKAMQTEYYASAESDATWYLWKLLSLLSVLRLLRKFIYRHPKTSGTCLISGDKKTSEMLTITEKISFPKNRILNSFYDRCVRIPPHTSDQVCGFVEHFVNDLLEAARNISSKEIDMHIEDFVGVGSLYEHWVTGEMLVCDLYVPVSPPGSYGSEVELWKKDPTLGMLGCARIKIVKTQNGCPCGDGNTDDDTLCLLHTHNEMNSVTVDTVGGPLCQENTPYLCKSQVVRWFRSTINQAWGEISHMYECELTHRSRAAPGALRVRLRSGKVIHFNITPVVQVRGSNVYLLSYLPSSKHHLSDTHWPISLSSYENALIQHFNKSLPPGSCHIQCLQILSFLYKKQNSLSGRSELTSHHLKMTLFHLLLTKEPKDWENEQLAARITDMLQFLEQRLKSRKFQHTLIGNPLLPRHIELPEEFQSAKPPNMFMHLASDTVSYSKTVQHLQELVKNAALIIQEYQSVKC